MNCLVCEYAKKSTASNSGYSCALPSHYCCIVLGSDKLIGRKVIRESGKVNIQDCEVVSYGRRSEKRDVYGNNERKPDAKW